MAGQNVSQKDRESASAAPALAAIRAKDTLAPEALALPAIGVIAEKETVTIERLRAVAERALQTFEAQQPESQRLLIAADTTLEKTHALVGAKTKPVVQKYRHDPSRRNSVQGRPKGGEAALKRHDGTISTLQSY
jgi:hypothetical protein